MGGELAAAEEQQDVEGVVDLLPAQPAVAVVPAADLVAVQPRKFRREYRVQVRVGVAADGRTAGVQGDVGEVVEAGEQADLGELADPGDEREPDVGIAVLDHRVEAAQKVPVRPGDLRYGECIQDRLVVLVHQNHHPLPGLTVQCFQKTGEAFRRGGVFADHPRPALNGVQLRHQVPVQVARLLEVAVAEAEPQHGVTHRPVPASVDGQPLEQRLAALEELLQRVQEQALAEAPRAGQEVVGAFLDQPLDVGGLVDVVAALLADGAEGLDSDGQLALGIHEGSLAHQRRSRA